MLNRRTVLCGLALAASLPFEALAGEEIFPSRPVRVIVPFSPGGPPDIIARLLASKLSERWGQQAYVENMPGAGGNTGYARAAHMPADGYTLVAMSPGYTVSPSLYAKLPFDPLKDFAAVALVAGSPNVVVVNPSVPANTLKELIQLIQANPGKYSYAHPSAGTIPHLLGELLKQRYKLDLVTVPFTGAGAAINSTLGGHTPIAIAAVPGAKPNIIAGKLRALAVTSAERSKALPDVPTVDEAGIPDLEGETLNGILVPAGVPSAIVDKIYQDISWALAQPDFRARLTELGFEPKGLGPEKYRAKIVSEIAKWGDVVRTAGIPKFE
jgi:tripartite-type tricarboxylate transporter receptor subunit TctC